MPRQRPLQLFDPQARYGGDGVELQLPSLHMGGQLLQLFRVGGVDLGCRNDHGLLRQREFDGGPGIVVHGLLGSGHGEARELHVDDFEVFDGVGSAGCIRDVDQVKQKPGAFDVAEELGAEAGAQVRALDEAGHVGDYVGELVGLLADGDDAEVGLEGGEGVVGDFGFGGGDAGDEGGLAGVGVADQADVGEQLEDEAVVALFAGAAQLVLAGGLVDGGCRGRRGRLWR